MIMTTSLMCLAIAINNEARGEPYLGQLAVGHVILNRTNQHFMGADTICETIYKPKQFSHIRRAKYPSDKSIQVARQLLTTCTINPIGSKLYFHEISLGKHKRSITIGHHIFY